MPASTIVTPTENGAGTPTTDCAALIALVGQAADQERQRIGAEQHNDMLETMIGLYVQSQRNLAMSRQALFAIEQQAKQEPSP